MFFDDLENLVKEAMGQTDENETNIPQETSTDGELVSKLAESIKDYEIEDNSKLGVAKLLMAIDILSS